MSTSVTRPAPQRYSAPSPAAAKALAAIAIAACPASGPVGRRSAYGGRENPIVVSQPMSASTGEATGSATKDMTPTATAQAISTPVPDSLPPRAAATVPMASRTAKPAGSAYGAASPDGFWPRVMSLPVERRNRPNLTILMNP